MTSRARPALLLALALAVHADTCPACTGGACDCSWVQTGACSGPGDGSCCFKCCCAPSAPTPPPAPRAPVPALPPLNIDPAQISVSGISSGADMAVQLQVAFSETFAGAAVFAGQAWHCAVFAFPNETLAPPDPKVPVCDGCPPGKTLTYDHCKNHPEVVRVPPLVQRAREAEAAGTIDALASLARRRIFLYRGTHDTCYNKGAVNATAEFFLGAGVAPRAVRFVNTVNSTHLLPTVNKPLCDWESFDGCDFDGAGEALRWIHSKSAPLAPRVNDTRSTWTQLRKFDQTKFFGDKFAGFASNASAFVPDECLKSASTLAAPPCRLHVFLHGCGIHNYDGYNMFVNYSGFTNWAATNRFVVLFPSIDWGEAATTNQERSGCFDGYGQTGADYDLRSGAQMTVIKRMVDAAVAGH